MTTHQLYMGGPASNNGNQTQWPAYVFNAADAKFANVDVAQHYGSPYAVLRRVLDFRNDYALRKYFTDHAVAAADVLNIMLIPRGTLVLGAYVEVERGADNGTAVTAKFGTAGGLTLGGADTASAVAVDLTAAAAKFSAPNGAWITASGAMSLATAQAVLSPDMLQITLASLATATLAGFGNLRLNASLLIVQANENTATNA